MRRQRSSFESSFNHDATTDNLDLNVANEDADQEIGANPVNQSSSLERNTGLLLRNTRRRTNPATDQDFLNSRLSSASPVYSSQLFQPSYQNWVTSPSSTSNPANFHFVASNSSYGYQRQENSQYAPGITTMQIAPAGTQLSPSPGFPQQNVTRSFPSSFTNGVHLPSTMRFAGISIDNRGQVGYQIQPSSASSAMRDNIESRFGNARAFPAPTQQIDVALRTLAPLRALIGVNPTLAPLQALIDVDPDRLLRTVRRAFDILVSAGAFVRYEDGRMVHDVNANLRLDVDNMSYEELLALEDCIGNVGSGFSEETILGALKRLTYQPMRLGGPVEEMCCICQEDFVDGEQLGILDCGHKYHVDCIKQWLLNKNNCPICKRTALAV
ncbi:hypothetical protein Vadar_020864 [Vaccinium darrowii]|uniref:Uncharacterized protein n=1 Tax=Vaccinium darrowii TaxID=229202 RepID=A0ACB7YFZ0_9ERIC|nr:hypothetical protein Vadar_020864 [Vaccinium darrowii]